MYDSPQVYVIAGPNGAGKSTAAPALLRDEIGLATFVNADVIAAGLCAFNPKAADFQAARIMLARVEELRQSRENFAFETTLATRGYARWLAKCRDSGFLSRLIFLLLPSPEVALERVAARVRQGGHDILESVVRRRFHRGLSNFFQLYQPIVDIWTILDNGETPTPRLVAHGGRGRPTVAVKESQYLELKEKYAT